MKLQTFQSSSVQCCTLKRFCALKVKMILTNASQPLTLVLVHYTSLERLQYNEQKAIETNITYVYITHLNGIFLY